MLGFLVVGCVTLSASSALGLVFYLSIFWCHLDMGYGTSFEGSDPFISTYTIIIEFDTFVWR